MSEMPRYNQGPTASVPVAAPTAPPVMNTIVYLLIGAAVLQIISAIFGVLNAGSEDYKVEARKQLEAQNVTGITPEMIDTITVVTVGTIIVMAVVSVILYVLIALFLKKGMGWARIVGAVLAVISFSQLIGLVMPGGIATIVQVLLGILAMVLCFTGPAAAYFAAKKNFKLASKGH